MVNEMDTRLTWGFLGFSLGGGFQKLEATFGSPDIYKMRKALFNCKGCWHSVSSRERASLAGFPGDPFLIARYSCRGYLVICKNRRLQQYSHGASLSCGSIG